MLNILSVHMHISQYIHRGSAWRDNREFVGQIKYGTCYRLWNPTEHLSFGGNFRIAAQTLFMCQRRQESPFSMLPDDCIFYILNMMRWDWVNDTSDEMRVEQKYRRRLRRRQQIAEADDMLLDEVTEAIPFVRANGQENDVVLGDEEPEEVAADAMEEGSSDDSEDADTSDDSDEESASSEEYAWGDHVGSRSFLYNDEDSSDSDDSNDSRNDDNDETERIRRGAMLRARRSILQLLRR